VDGSTVPFFGVVFRAIGQFVKGLAVDFDYLHLGEHAEQVAIADALLGDGLLLAACETQQLATDEIFEFRAEGRSFGILLTAAGFVP
jgi:hypothetical protein